MSKLDKVITVTKIAIVVCSYFYLSRKVGEEIGYWAANELQNLKDKGE